MSDVYEMNKKFLIENYSRLTKIDDFAFLENVLLNLISKDNKELEKHYDFITWGSEEFIFGIKDSSINQFSDYLNVTKNSKSSYLKSFKYFENNKIGREITVPNPISYFPFIYNTLKVVELFDSLYDEKKDGIHIVNFSPIVKNEYLISEVIDYLDFFVDVNIDTVLQDKNNILYNKGKEFEYKSQYNYVLKLDISTFYDSIYTHLFDRIATNNVQYENIYNLLENNNSDELKNYIKWLDEFNMSINKRETAGIITGTFSSRICSELILLTIDKELEKNLNEIFGNVDITCTRFIDDFSFYYNDPGLSGRIEDVVVSVLKKFKLNLNPLKSIKGEVSFDNQIIEMKLVEEFVDFIVENIEDSPLIEEGDDKYFEESMMLIIDNFFHNITLLLRNNNYSKVNYILYLVANKFRNCSFNSSLESISYTKFYIMLKNFLLKEIFNHSQISEKAFDLLFIFESDFELPEHWVDMYTKKFSNNIVYYLIASDIYNDDNFLSNDVFIKKLFESKNKDHNSRTKIEKFIFD